MKAPTDEHNDSAFVSHVACKHCSSSDAAAVYTDGHIYCFSCQTYTPGDEEIKAANTAPIKINTNLIEGFNSALPARGLREDTCRKFDYQVGTYKGRPVQIANYRNDAGEVTHQKIRDADKNFIVLGDSIKSVLYGQHLWTTGKKVVICEGEIDALSISQAQKNSWPVVSVPAGCQSAKKALMNAWDWLSGFDEIVLFFDGDAPGKEAALACAESLPLGKVKIARLSGYKDANEALVAGKEADIVNAIWRAKEWRPDGIVSTADMRDLVIQTDKEATAAYPYEKLNKITKGIRPSTLVVLTAGSGVGKSTLVTEIAYHLHKQNHRCGMLMLEETNKRTARGILGLHMEKNIVQDESSATDEEVQQAYDEVFQGDQQIQMFDHFGNTDLDTVILRIQYMVRAGGCTHVFLDHISIVISSMTMNKGVDERRLIDSAMTQLRTMTQELGITLFLVSHLTRPKGEAHESGGRIMISQLRGSGALAQLSDMVIGLIKNPDEQDTRELTVLKNRFSGEVGFAGTLKYDRERSRLIDADDAFTKF